MPLGRTQPGAFRSPKSEKIQGQLCAIAGQVKEIEKKLAALGQQLQGAQVELETKRPVDGAGKKN
jgi:hypothetical protein